MNFDPRLSFRQVTIAISLTLVSTLASAQTPSTPRADRAAGPQTPRDSSQQGLSAEGAEP